MKIKTKLLIISALISTSIAHSQVSISNNNSPPASSAMLDIKSTTKGFLPPRMTYAQLQAIPNPASGLIVFCTDCGPNGLGALSVYILGSWNTLSVNNCTMMPSSPTSGTHVATPEQITWNWNTVTGALGYKWNSTNNYTTAIEMGSSTSKIETGINCGTSYTRYAWAYNSCGNSTVLTMTKTSGACFVCGNSITKTHVAGSVAPVTKTTTYATVTNVPGAETKCWITKNLGSDQQATVVNDATEASAGWYWQFNHMQGFKHDGTTRTPNTTWITYIEEYGGWVPANDPCLIELGTGWRIPSATEFTQIDEDGNWTNWDGPFNSILKMHAAGQLTNASGSLDSRGVRGYYWSSTQSSYNHSAQALFFSSTNSSVNMYQKAYAFTLRCIKD